MLNLGRIGGIPVPIFIQLRENLSSFQTQAALSALNHSLENKTDFSVFAQRVTCAT